MRWKKWPELGDGEAWNAGFTYLISLSQDNYERVIIPTIGDTSLEQTKGNEKGNSILGGDLSCLFIIYIVTVEGNNYWL